MAKVSGPLLSISAGGTIAKTQVYSKWRGVPYVRQHVVPANPQSAEQTKTRSLFGWLMATWKLMDPDAQAPWTAFASGKPLTDRNAFNKSNIPMLRGLTVITDLIGSPGARGGLAAASLALTPGSGTISAALGAPDLPSGWSITKAVAVAQLQQDPQTASTYKTVTASDSSDPYAPAFSGLAAGTYVVNAWFVYAKPDLTLAYGPSISALAVVT